jgi:hypothetical protein
LQRRDQLALRFDFPRFDSGYNIDAGVCAAPSFLGVE